MSWWKSGFRFCEQLKRTATENIICVLEKWFFRYGFPDRIRTEGGPQFRLKFRE